MRKILGLFASFKATFSLRGYFCFLRLFLKVLEKDPFKTRFQITFEGYF